MNLAAIAGLLALVPFSVGPLPEQAASITARLCSGGTVKIPVKRRQPPDVPCLAKGCHAGSCRKRFDLAQ